MARSYGSFLVRCWRLAGDEQRIEIEHIQSHERTLVATVAAAVEWICARADGMTGAHDARPQPPAAPYARATRAYQSGPVEDTGEQLPPREPPAAT